MVQAAFQLAALGYGIFAGETQRRAANKGRREAQEAQQQAEAAALGEAKRADQADAKASQKAPDLNVLLSDQLRPNKAGRGAFDVNRLLLGRPGQLGL